jgi:hypothetical protein
VNSIASQINEQSLQFVLFESCLLACFRGSGYSLRHLVGESFYAYLGDFDTLPLCPSKNVCSRNTMDSKNIYGQSLVFVL